MRGKEVGVIANLRDGQGEHIITLEGGATEGRAEMEDRK